MRKIARYSFVVLLLGASVWLTACERTLSGVERAAVLAFSEDATDNLLSGLTAGDYAAVSRDFDADLHEELSAAEFASWRQELGNQLGNYLSRRIDRVARADEFFVVFYQAQFEQEEANFSVAFHASDHSIATLSLDSEAFSWSPFLGRR